MLRFLAQHEIRIALQTVDEYFPKITFFERCKCLRLGRYQDMFEERPDRNEAVDVAWKKF
jgi:hypothetical protein